MTDLPRNILPIFVLGVASFFAPATAHAHLGHVGELAGHSHWLGLGALAAAAAALALLPKKKKAEAQEDEASAEADGAQEIGESQEETAGA